MSYLGPGEAKAVLAPQGTVMSLGGTTVRVLADRGLTEGRYSLYAIDLGPDGGGASPHFHRTFAESFQVLNGEVELYDGRAWSAAGPGAHLYIPPGSIHGFRNATSEPVSMLMLSCPGAPREDYFAELAAVIDEQRQLSAPDWTELFARHDQYMVEG